ncbi:OmpA family protein [Demetria terragena]|uniref:OmpA family protein n=1 Tax=Demetria terragena TaxID=63959 RepID=UPI0003747C3F|nr:OmpA family protein [Demetria terragena]
MRRTSQITAAVTALAGVMTLTACQDTGATSTAPTETSNASSAGVTTGSTTAGDVGPDGTDAGRREHLTQDGGYVLQGSTITFVYRNGMRHAVDLGQDIPEGDVSLPTSKGRLLINQSGATLTTARGVTTVNRQGVGAVADATGVVLVAADGSTTCGNSKGIQFVGSNGSKGALDTGGYFYAEKDGTQVSGGKSPAVNSLAGRFTVCNVGNTSSVDLYSDVLFRFDSAELTPAGRAVIESAARSMRTSVKGKPVNLVGHTDSKGSATYNETLGKRRADAVAAELSQDIPGIDLRVRSAGETEPVAANVTSDGQDNSDGRAKNRRVTISWTR